MVKKTTDNVSKKKPRSKISKKEQDGAGFFGDWYKKGKQLITRKKPMYKKNESLLGKTNTRSNQPNNALGQQVQNPFTENVQERKSGIILRKTLGNRINKAFSKENLLNDQKFLITLQKIKQINQNEANKLVNNLINVRFPYLETKDKKDLKQFIIQVNKNVTQNPAGFFGDVLDKLNEKKKLLLNKYNKSYDNLIKFLKLRYVPIQEQQLIEKFFNEKRSQGIKLSDAINEFKKRFGKQFNYNLNNQNQVHLAKISGLKPNDFIENVDFKNVKRVLEKINPTQRNFLTDLLVKRYFPNDIERGRELVKKYNQDHGIPRNNSNVDVDVKYFKDVRDLLWEKSSAERNEKEAQLENLLNNYKTKIDKEKSGRVNRYLKNIGIFRSVSKENINKYALELRRKGVPLEEIMPKIEEKFGKKITTGLEKQIRENYRQNLQNLELTNQELKDFKILLNKRARASQKLIRENEEKLVNSFNKYLNGEDQLALSMYYQKLLRHYSKQKITGLNTLSNPGNELTYGQLMGFVLTKVKHQMIRLVDKIETTDSIKDKIKNLIRKRIENRIKKLNDISENEDVSTYFSDDTYNPKFLSYNNQVNNLINKNERQNIRQNNQVKEPSRMSSLLRQMTIKNNNKSQRQPNLSGFEFNKPPSGERTRIRRKRPNQENYLLNPKNN